jgi:hypothetical protein
MIHLIHSDLGQPAVELKTEDHEEALAWFKARADSGRITIKNGNGPEIQHRPDIKKHDLRGRKTPMGSTRMAPIADAFTTTVRVGSAEYAAVVKFGGSFSGGINKLGRMLIQKSDTFDTFE